MKLIRSTVAPVALAALSMSLTSFVYQTWGMAKANYFTSHVADLAITASAVSAAAEKFQGYEPSSCEKYIIEHADQIGYASEANPSGCAIWNDPNTTNKEIHESLRAYSDGLDKYITAVKDFQPVPDLISSIKKGNYEVCATVKLHPDGVSALFPSNQLSLTKSGYIEPLTPPMRFHKVCIDHGKHLMSLDYLVHDFEKMCRNLKPTSKRVLIDMGASLSFHGNNQPIFTLMSVYEKFGFHFDHIYAFEMKFTAPEKVYQELLQEKYFSAYHWINTGVSNEEGNKMNPLNSILREKGIPAHGWP